MYVPSTRKRDKEMENKKTKRGVGLKWNGEIPEGGEESVSLYNWDGIGRGLGMGKLSKVLNPSPGISISEKGGSSELRISTER